MEKSEISWSPYLRLPGTDLREDDFDSVAYKCSYRYAPR